MREIIVASRALACAVAADSVARPDGPRTRTRRNTITSNLPALVHSRSLQQRLPFPGQYSIGTGGQYSLGATMQNHPYILKAAEPKERLYDLRGDPGQRHNLVSAPASEPMLRRLCEALARYS